MIAYIDGALVGKSPTHAIIDCSGIGYFLNISLNTYSRLPDKGSLKLHVHEVIREDSRTLFGFADESERQVFRLLISVSGVGASTARMILSALTPQQLSNVILTDDVAALKAVKGIGAKSAQRIIIDLRDKIGKEEISADFSMPQNNTSREEALSALVMLGFPKNRASKAVDKTLKSEGADISVEQLVKHSLKNL